MTPIDTSKISDYIKSLSEKSGVYIYMNCMPYSTIPITWHACQCKEGFNRSCGAKSAPEEAVKKCLAAEWVAIEATEGGK